MEDLDDLLESERRLRVFAAWLAQPIEGYVEHRLWSAAPDLFILETDDHIGYQFDCTDPSLRVELIGAS
jgi:hypothetical protein